MSLPGPDTTPSGLSGLFRPRDFSRCTDHGAVGYPEIADAETGRLLLDAIVRKVGGVVENLMGEEEFTADDADKHR